MTLDWLQPHLLWLLPLPLLLLLRPVAKPTGNLRRLADPRHWPWLLRGQSDPRRREWGLILVLWLLLLAAAGPYLGQQQQQSHSAAIALVVDISPSMAVADAAPSRLGYAQRLLSELTTELDGHRLGLVTFSANAYMTLPLTRDHGAIDYFIHSLSTDLTAKSGSNIQRALGLAADMLDEDSGPGTTPGLIILVSDGEIHDRNALRSAQRIHQLGHQIHTLGVGTLEGGPVPHDGRFIRQQGEIVSSHLQRASLQAIARAGGGQYQDLGQQAWPLLVRSAEQLARPSLDQRGAVEIEHALFAWPLALALLILLGRGLRQQTALAQWLLPLIIAAPLLYAPSSEAGILTPFKTREAEARLQAGDYVGAMQIYSELENYGGQMGVGAAAYRAQNWPQALAAFEQARLSAANAEQAAAAAFNTGNTLTQLGRAEAALEAFRDALELRPDYPKARLNLGLLEQHLAGRGAPRSGSEGEPGKAAEPSAADSDDGPASEPSPTAGDGTTTPNQEAEAKQQAGPTPRQQPGPSSDRQTELVSRWSQLSAQSAPVSPQSIQQLNNLREDGEAILRRRFSIEDGEYSGQVEEKPW